MPPRPRHHPAREPAGFTLIEALVALCILAIASNALMAATGAHIDRVRRLEDHALAQMVAENRLAELRLAHSRPAASQDRVPMGRQEWDIVTTTAPTADPDLVDVTIAVSVAGVTGTVLRLRGFIDAGGMP